jgi:hypothetical protein
MSLFAGPRNSWRYSLKRICQLRRRAVSDFRFEIVCLFIEEFEVNQENVFGKTSLCYAVTCRNGEQDLEIARFLLENKAKVNQGGEKGPLWLAVVKGSNSMVQLLLQYRVNPNIDRRAAVVDYGYDEFRHAFLTLLFEMEMQKFCACC